MVVKSVLAVSGTVLLALSLPCAYILRERKSSGPAYPQLTTLLCADTLRQFKPDKQVNPSHPVVLCFFCDCDNCHVTARRLASLKLHNNPNVFAAFSVGPQDAREFVRTTGFPGQPLLDSNSALAERYDASVCPRVFVLQGQKVLYSNSEGGRPVSEAELRRIAKYL